MTVAKATAVLLASAALIGCGSTEDQQGLGRIGSSIAERTATPEPKQSERAHERRRASDRTSRLSSRRAEDALARCDANIAVDAATTTCNFAQNVFFGYWNAGGGDFEAYSPVSERLYRVECRGGSNIVCRAGDGAEVRFSERAVAVYDEVQADAYASSHDLGPQAATNEPWDDESSSGEYDDYDAGQDEDESSYDDGYSDGDDVTEPGENIPYYDEGRGYRVQCADGTYSQSGGIQGACSHHGGVR